MIYHHTHHQPYTTPQLSWRVGWILLLSSLAGFTVASPGIANVPVPTSLTQALTEQSPQSVTTNSSELALDAYTLGPGDQISIEVLSTASVFAQPIEQTVLVDGTLTMP